MGQILRGWPTQSLLGATGWFALCYGLALLGYLGVNAAAGRLLTSADFGYFVLVSTLALVIGQTGTVGWHRTGLREAARINDADPRSPAVQRLRDQTASVSRTLLPAVSTVAGVVSALVLVVAGRTSAGDLLVGLGLGVLVACNGYQKLWGNLLRGFGWLRLASFLEGGSGGAAVALLQAALLTSLLGVAGTATLPVVVGLAGLGYFIPVLFAARAMRRVWGRAPAGAQRGLLGGVVRSSWRVANVQVAGFATLYVELWLAALVLPGAELSGFAAAQRLALLLTIPATVLQVVFTPAIARLLSTRENHRLEILVRAGASISTVLALLAAAPLLVMPGPSLSLVFGAGYGAADGVLVLLVIGSLANVVTGMCAPVLLMAMEESVLNWIQWSSVIIRMAVGLPVVAAFGATGLAWSSLAVSVVSWSLLARAARHSPGVLTLPALRPQLALLRTVRG